MANPSQPTRIAPGKYTHHGYTIQRIHNNRWRITHEAEDFDGSVASFRAAVVYVNEHADRPLLEPAEQVPRDDPEATLKPSKAKAKGKVTPEAVGYIRDQTAGFFGEGRVTGKVARYRALAAELGLGVETVARISRGDSHSEVG